MRTPWRSDGHGDATEAGGRQEPGDGRSGQGDVVGVAPAQPQARSGDDAVQKQDVAGDGGHLEEPAGDDETPARAQGMPERVGEVPAVRDNERSGDPPAHQREDGDDPPQPHRRRTAVRRDLAHEP